MRQAGHYNLDRKTIANCGLQIANCKLPNSSFILHPSSFSRALPFGSRLNGLHPSSFHLPPSRRGVTLVEMLIVVSIIVILTVGSLAIIQPLAERRVREAARQVNVFVSSARSRAIEIGRPCGVILRRAANTNTPSASLVLDMCEVPPPYAGDAIDSVVKVQNLTIGAGPPTIKIQIRDGDFSSGLIRPGDLIRLNNQGPYYNILLPGASDFQLDANGYFSFSPATATTPPWIDSKYLTAAINAVETPMQSLPWPDGDWSSPVAFQILRQPDKVKSAAFSLQLPAGTAVDLDYSGTDPVDTGLFQNTLGTSSDVAVLFSPNGAVEGYYLNGVKKAATGPIFLLVGSRSRVRDFTNDKLPANPKLDERPNWAELSSIWVTVNYQTGMASTDDNFAINFATQKDLSSNPIKWDDVTTWPFFINLARTYARQSQSMGGR
jgi:prepilin-type N-terminal cleavage/methylation domain-containing protein